MANDLGDRRPGTSRPAPCRPGGPGLLLLATLLLSGAGASPAPVGVQRVPAGPVAAVEGRITIADLRDAADAAIWLEPLERRPPSVELADARLDQRGLDFVPHVLVVPVGTTVRFRNSDTVLHNIFAPGLGGEAFDLGTWPTGEERAHRFLRTGVTTLLCNVHPEMEAFIVVVPTPWYARTDADGRFRIADVPPGRYRLHAWHERCERIVREIEVPVATPLTLSMRLLSPRR